MDKNDIGYLPAISIGTLIVFYLIWAALHDIARAGEPDYTFEYIALGLSVPAFATLHRAALRHLGRKAKSAWLIGTGLVLALYNLSALAAVLAPKYPLDPVLGSLFLGVGLPVLVLICFHLARVIPCRE